jgi:tetratricopeptide (TPR) repeat protein
MIWFTTRRWQVLICLLLAGAVLLPYLKVAGFDFITLDDDLYVYRNPLVLAGLTSTGVKWAATTQHASNWHPLTWLSHMLDAQIYGSWAGGHHLTNVFFHIANTLLLFLFLIRVTRALWPSALVAALFALHPLHVESVAWVSERKDVLSAFFWIATMWAYAGYATSPSVRRYLAVVLLFALGLMAKPMLVALPLVLLLLDYWPLRRVKGLAPAPGSNGGRAPQPGPVPQSFWRLLGEKIPLFVLAALSCLITLSAQEGSGSLMPLDIRPLGPRIANALVAYVQYVVKMFWPSPLAMFCPLAPIPWWQALAAGLILAAASALLLARARRSPYLAVGWLWYLGTMVPVIGLVQVGGQAMADRYTYIPSIGLFIMAAWGVGEATARWRYQKAILALGSAVVLLACWWGTWRQIGYWRNSETLFVHTLKVTGANYVAYNHLGTYLTDQGRFEQAIIMYKKAQAAAPTYPPSYNNLGIIYAKQGRFAEAIDNFQKAIQLTPDNSSYRRNLAVAYREQGEKSKVEAVLKNLQELMGNEEQ